jgi:hypothetical protein
LISESGRAWRWRRRQIGSGGACGHENITQVVRNHEYALRRLGHRSCKTRAFQGGSRRESRSERDGWNRGKSVGREGEREGENTIEREREGQVERGRERGDRERARAREREREREIRLNLGRLGELQLVLLARRLWAETLHTTHLLPQAHSAQEPKPVQEHHCQSWRSGFALPKADALPGTLRTRVVWAVRMKARSHGGKKLKFETICRPTCPEASLVRRKREM